MSRVEKIAEFLVSTYIILPLFCLHVSLSALSVVTEYIYSCCKIIQALWVANAQMVSICVFPHLHLRTSKQKLPTVLLSYIHMYISLLILHSASSCWQMFLTAITSFKSRSYEICFEFDVLTKTFHQLYISEMFSVKTIYINRQRKNVSIKCKKTFYISI